MVRIDGADEGWVDTSTQPLVTSQLFKGAYDNLAKAIDAQVSSAPALSSVMKAAFLQVAGVIE